MDTQELRPTKFLLLLALGAILLILWRVLVIGISEYYVIKAENGDVGAIRKALSWNANHPKAQYLQARQLSSSDPFTAEKLLTTSILKNPTDVDALQARAELQHAYGNKDLANSLMLESTRLAPANKFVRLDAGRFWARTGQWDKAIESWRQALNTSPQLGKEVFPILMQLAEGKETLDLLKPLIENPPDWWDNFVEYLTKNTKNLDTVATVAAMRIKSNVPFSADERKFVVRRLMKDGKWPRAYIAWVNGLDSTQIRYLGSVYDGNFELEPSNEGFGWYITKNKTLDKAVTIRKQRTYGGDGEKALQLTFSGQEIIYRHMYQPLYLTIGEHEFRANLKTDRLKTRGGLKWVVRCAGDQKTVLGESARLLGSSEWREVKFRFQVPNSKECGIGQILRLESTGERPFDHKLEGDIWFSRLGIRPIRQATAAAVTEKKSKKRRQ